MRHEEKKAVSLLREEIKTAHQYLEGTLGDVTEELVHWIPPGTALPVGATYAHVVVSEDATINGMLKGEVPLFAGPWAGKVGVSELPPPPDPKKPGFPDWSAWSRSVKVDLAALRKFAKAVYSATDWYLASLTDDALDRPADLSALGMGKSTVRFVLVNGVLGNALTHCGEIACLKGLQGKRGYPF